MSAWPTTSVLNHPDLRVRPSTQRTQHPLMSPGHMTALFLCSIRSVLCMCSPPRAAKHPACGSIQRSEIRCATAYPWPNKGWIWHPQQIPTRAQNDVQFLPNSPVLVQKHCNYSIHHFRKPFPVAPTRQSSPSSLPQRWELRCDPARLETRPPDRQWREVGAERRVFAPSGEGLHTDGLLRERMEGEREMRWLTSRC